LCDGKPIPLSPKSFEILLALIRSDGQLLMKDELMRQVWPDSFVEEANLTVNISALRKVLGGGPEGQLYIETIPKRGYRFIAKVAVLQQDSEKPELAKEIPATAASPYSVPARAKQAVLKHRWGSLSWKIVGFFLVLVALLVVGIIGWQSRSAANVSHASPIRSLAVLPLENLSGDAQDYFADGMTDELITDLAQIGALRVISRTSVMPYKGARKPLRSKALMVPSPKLPIRISLLKRPKLGLAWTMPHGALREPLEANRRMKLPCWSKTSMMPFPGATTGSVPVASCTA
jgi:DNA-binding winged helix-turn-helix (wHTH) protein